MLFVELLYNLHEHADEPEGEYNMYLPTLVVHVLDYMDL